MADAPRILFMAAATSMSGGSEKHISDLLGHLPSGELDLALLAPAGGELVSFATDIGVKTYSAALQRGFSADRVSAVRNAIEEFQPDIVHAHGSRAAFYARIADPRAAERVIFTVHGIHADKSPRLARRTALLSVERALRPRTVRFVTVCESDLTRGAYLRMLDWERARVVYNGIELPQPPGVPGMFRAEINVKRHAPLVVCVGRFEPAKDHATLLDAFARLLIDKPDAVLALIGSGPLEGQLRERCVALGISTRVRFVPPRAAIAHAYVDADVVALSSRWEGLPYTILEALAYKRPVVATRVDGIPEAIEHGVDGMLVEPGQPTAFAMALNRLLSAPEAAATLGESGAKRVAEQFSIERMIESLRGVYAEVLGE